MWFSWQEYWSGLPFPFPGDLPDPGIEPVLLESSALADVFFTAEPSGKPNYSQVQCFSNRLSAATYSWGHEINVVHWNQHFLKGLEWKISRYNNYVCLCAWEHVCVHAHVFTQGHVLVVMWNVFLTKDCVKIFEPDSCQFSTHTAPFGAHTHCYKRHLECWFVWDFCADCQQFNWFKRQTCLQLWNKKRSSVLIETFTLSKAGTPCLCLHCKWYVLSALFSYHNPWSTEGAPDPVNIPLGSDITGNGRAGGSLSIKGQAPQKWGFSGSSAGKESTCNAGYPGSIPGLERSPGEGIGYPFQCSWASLAALSLTLWSLSFLICTKR